MKRKPWKKKTTRWGPKTDGQQALKILNEFKREEKSITQDYTETVDCTRHLDFGYFNLIDQTSIVPGEDSDEYVGQKISLTKLSIRGEIHNAVVEYRPDITRLIIFQVNNWARDSNSSDQQWELFYDPTNPDKPSLLNSQFDSTKYERIHSLYSNRKTSRGKFKVLLDRMFSTDKQYDVGRSVIKRTPFKFYKKWDEPLTIDMDTIGLAIRNNIVLAWISSHNSVSGTGSIDKIAFSSRFNYYDS